MLEELLAKGPTRSKSKFVVVGEIAKEDDHINNIEILKEKIKDLLGNNGLHGAVHDKKAGKEGKIKHGGLGTKPGPGTLSRSGGPKLTIGKKKKETRNRGGWSGPLSVIAESRLNSMK